MHHAVWPHERQAGMEHGDINMLPLTSSCSSNQSGGCRLANRIAGDFIANKGAN